MTPSSLYRCLNPSIRMFVVFLFCSEWTADNLNAAVRTALVPAYKTSAFSDPARPEMAFGTDLWRRAFTLNEEKKKDSEVDADHADDNAVLKSHAEASENFDVTVSASADAAMSLVDISEEIFADETTISMPQSDAEQVAAADCSFILSDWERAACNTHLAGAAVSGAKGPSIVTIVVGMVGAVVIFGAYFRSSGRSQ